MQTLMRGSEEEASEKLDGENALHKEKNTTLIRPDIVDRNKCSYWLMWRETMNEQTNDLPIGLLWVELKVTEKHVLPSGRR